MDTQPSLLARIQKPQLFRRIFNKLLSYFFLSQWTVLIGPSIKYKSLNWKNFKTLVSPLDRFWADPFIWVEGDKYYLFVEELLYETNRGRISCLTLDKDMQILSNQVVLERPYHLSYPFLFEYEGQLYMIPETGKNNGIELYRCTHFPGQWEFVKTLINNVYAVDTTLLNLNGKWWLFANIKSENNSTFDTLHLYFADHPLSEQWTPHPLNPIVKDIQSARPAGRIFNENGALIRPSQDCSIRYGYAINFNRIATLNETSYSEVREHTFKPPIGFKILTVHTYNDENGLTAIDAIQRRWKF